MIPARVVRMTYTGDLGYELWVAPSTSGRSSTCCGTPARTGSPCSGSCALMALRMEKMFGTWMREYRLVYSPLEAWTATSSSTTTSSAQRHERRPAALARLPRDRPRSRRTGRRRQPIWHDGDVVGWVTSGAFTPTSRWRLATCPPSSLRRGVQWGRLEVEIIGHRRPACLLTGTRPRPGREADAGEGGVAVARAADDRRPRWRRTRTSPGCGRRRRSPWVPALDSSSFCGRRRSRCCATRRRSLSMTPFSTARVVGSSMPHSTGQHTSATAPFTVPFRPRRRRAVRRRRRARGRPATGRHRLGDPRPSCARNWPGSPRRSSPSALASMTAAADGSGSPGCSAGTGRSSTRSAPVPTTSDRSRAAMDELAPRCSSIWRRKLATTDRCSKRRCRTASSIPTRSCPTPRSSCSADDRGGHPQRRLVPAARARPSTPPSSTSRDSCRRRVESLRIEPAGRRRPLRRSDVELAVGHLRRIAGDRVARRRQPRSRRLR